MQSLNSEWAKYMWCTLAMDGNLIYVSRSIFFTYSHTKKRHRRLIFESCITPKNGLKKNRKKDQLIKIVFIWWYSSALSLCIVTAVIVTNMRAHDYVHMCERVIVHAIFTSPFLFQKMTTTIKCKWMSPV